MSTDTARNFRQLRVWQAAHNLVLGIYRITKDFPAEETFGLVSQMRRAASSVPLNIVEGFARRTQKEKARFYNVAQGSLEELRYALMLARDLNYFKEFDSIDELAESVGKMLGALLRSIVKKNT